MDKNFNLSFKKNDIEKLLLNLDQNPYTQKNKDFRYTLSLIYELIEEEFADTFDTKNPILRQTDITLEYDGNNASVFISPPYNFDYYLKSKGSLYRLRPEYKGSDTVIKLTLICFLNILRGWMRTLICRIVQTIINFIFTFSNLLKRLLKN